MTTIQAPLTEDIKAAFTKAVFTKIDGKQTYTTVMWLETEAIWNTAFIECCVSVPHKNLCRAIDQAHNYMLQVGDSFQTSHIQEVRLNSQTGAG